MKELKKELKISPSLREQEKISYASDVINVPEGGIDCNEGWQPVRISAGSGRGHGGF